MSEEGLAKFEFLAEPVRLQLYGKLLEQVKRDFSRAGEELRLDLPPSPAELVYTVQEVIASMSSGSPGKVQQLLYIADVNESDFQKSFALTADQRIAYWTMLLLRRCWEKVHTRQKYG